MDAFAARVATIVGRKAVGVAPTDEESGLISQWFAETEADDASDPIAQLFWPEYTAWIDSQATAAIEPVRLRSVTYQVPITLLFDNQGIVEEATLSPIDGEFLRSVETVDGRVFQTEGGSSLELDGNGDALTCSDAEIDAVTAALPDDPNRLTSHLNAGPGPVFVPVPITWSGS